MESGKNFMILKYQSFTSNYPFFNPKNVYMYFQTVITEQSLMFLKFNISGSILEFEVGEAYIISASIPLIVKGSCKKKGLWRCRKYTLKLFLFQYDNDASKTPIL